MAGGASELLLLMLLMLLLLLLLVVLLVLLLLLLLTAFGVDGFSCAGESGAFECREALESEAMRPIEGLAYGLVDEVRF